MQESKKSSTIHVNPTFKVYPKQVIHINPNKQINMVIHVNPKMVNSLTACKFQPKTLEQDPDSTLLGSHPKLEESPPNIPKSVYVNPKLMQNLLNKMKKIKNEVNEVETKSQHTTECSKFVINKTTKSDDCSIKNNLSPNLISLSKRKLIRIRPENEPKVIAKNQKKIISYTGTPKLLRKVEIKKIVNKNQLKEIRHSYRSKKISTNQLKKINVSSNCQTLSVLNATNKYKIDRTAREEKSKPQVARKTQSMNNKNLVKIDGIFYRSSKSTLVKSSNLTTPTTKTSLVFKKSSLSSPQIRRVRKHGVVHGKISKINTNISSKISLSNSSQKFNYKQMISNRMKQRSLQILRHKMCKNNQPCLLFQRFGYCAKNIEGTCPKVHDKKQVALCKNFLQGKCHMNNCPLSHNAGPEKMPTCKYFLEGCCTRANCQYLHVKVSTNTPICVPFLRGFCAKGDQCKGRHANICPEFDKYGTCAKGKNCPYPHKTCVLPEQNTLRLPKSLNQYKKHKVEKIKSVDISSQDDTKKRYYDDDCTSANLDRIESSIEKKIQIGSVVHNAPLAKTQTSNDNEMKSQPISNNNRLPIGPLPSYIPID